LRSTVRPQGGDETGSALTLTSLLEALRQMRSRHVLCKELHLLAPVLVVCVR
jgi:hypothetical protein